MHRARSGATATLLANNNVLLAGGGSGQSNIRPSSELFLAKNVPPLVVNPIADQSGSYGSPFLFTLPSDTFSDPDVGQVLSYSASGLPPGIAFDGPTRAFSGTPTNTGTFAVTVTATDNGSPPLSTNDVFDIVIAKPPLTVTANNTNRPYGEQNPSLTGSLIGVLNNDNITVTFNTTATPASPPGNYAITPSFLDPDSRLLNYSIVTNVGILHIQGVILSTSGSGANLTFCWPANAAAFLLECADNLLPPVTWQPITNGLATNDTTICLTPSSEPSVPARFYRLRLP